jgi:hypothetical protein
MPLVYHPAPDPPIASRIRNVGAVKQGELLLPYALAARSRLAARARYGGLTSCDHWLKCPDRVSRSPVSILGGRNPVPKLALRQYRVSHLGVHAAQEGGHPARGDRPGRRPRPGRVHVIPVVGAGHGPVPPPPPTTARRMTLALAGRRPAGPLPRPEPGMRTEEGLAEWTPPSMRSSEHRSPPRWKATPYPMRTAPAQAGSGVVG